MAKTLKIYNDFGDSETLYHGFRIDVEIGLVDENLDVERYLAGGSQHGHFTELGKPMQY